MKIFCQCLGKKTIEPNRGDFITEFQLMNGLRQFADVYYSGRKFDEHFLESSNNYKKTLLERAREQKYDAYYVRNNPKFFNSITKSMGKKIYFFSPYDKKAFQGADAIASLTQSFTDRLRNGIDTHGYPKNFKCDKVYTLHQVVSERFRPLQDHPKTKIFRENFGGGFIIGHFGALRRSCFPYSFSKILPEIKKEHPEVSVVFSTKKSQNCPDLINKNIKECGFSYKDMPYAISACDLILYNFRGTDGHFVGSMKILEAIACGVPVLSPRFDAREEELGKNYELFHDFSANGGRFSAKIEKEMKNKIIGLIEDKDQQKRLSKYVHERAKFHQMVKSAKRLKKTMEEILA